MTDTNAADRDGAAGTAAAGAEGAAAWADPAVELAGAGTDAATGLRSVRSVRQDSVSSTSKSSCR